MTHPILTALSAWIKATDAYAECTRGLDHTPLRVACDGLIRVLDDETRSKFPAGQTRTRVAWRDVVSRVMLQVNAVTEQFESDSYGDDDTDAPCDVEWDVHSIVAALDPSYKVPEEIEPSHTVGTVFPHPGDV